MLQLPIAALNAIAEGARPIYKVRVYFQAPQDYTEDDNLQDIGQLRWSMSGDGGYEIVNGRITLKNTEFCFSQFLNRELPDNKLVEIYLTIAGTDVLMASCVVRSWKLDPTALSLDVNASLLLDTLKLRTTSVYAAPRDISVLKRVYGDHSGNQIKCTPIDKDGYIHHASDIPMQSIITVCVDGEPQTGGFRAYPAWQDETGRSVAVVIFDEPQYEKAVTISGKGAIDLTTGDLIENPAAFLRDVFLALQGYAASSIESGELDSLYSACLKAEMKIAPVLDEQVTVKKLLDELALNIHAQWMLSDRKSVMRLRAVDGTGGSLYHFREEECDPEAFALESGTLINEVTLNFGYDHASGSYRGSITKHSPLSKLVYGEAKKTYSLRMVQQARQANIVADGILKTSSVPELFTSFKHDSRSIHIEVGDRCTISHSAGIGANGFVAAACVITSKDLLNMGYTARMERENPLYAPELLTLTQTAQPGTPSGFTMTSVGNVRTFTFFVLLADNSYGPPLEGAEITIAGVRQITNKAGQVKFILDRGRYTMTAECPGYASSETQITI